MPHHEIGHYGARIVETIREPLLVLDTCLRVRSANPAFHQLFQVDRDETLETLLFDLGSGQWNSPDLRQWLEDVLSRRATEAGFEVRSHFPHLGARVMLLNAHRLDPEAGDKDAFVLVAIEDITARRNAEERAEAYARRLEQSNRELQDFAQVASHDLQEPLRKIQAFGDLLKRQADRLDDDGRDYLSSMLGAATRMRSLVNALLGLARVATRGKPFVRVDLAQVVGEVLVDLEGRLLEAGGRVEVGELPQIEGDAMQMRQLFQNLIGNALKYHRPEVPPVVQVDASPLKSVGGGRTVAVSVRDNGIGFDEKYLGRIFTPFQRLHSRNEYEGTGMGLAICRRIAERHGGSITAGSTPGQGATFTVSLPVEQRENVS